MWQSRKVYPGQKIMMPDDEWLDEYIELIEIIEEDNSRDFIRRISEPCLVEFPEDKKSRLGVQIIENSAMRCAELVASGETAYFLNCDFGFDPHGWSALHQAALNVRQIKMLRFLLEYGYSADVRGDCYKLSNENYQLCYEDYQPSFHDALPLNVALYSLRFGWGLQKFWASTDISAPSLLKKLYTMDTTLEVVRLLAVNTTEFKHEFSNYAKEGKMVEVGALLLAAGDRLLPLSISEGEDDFNSFKEISHFLQEKNNNTDEFPEFKETVKLLDIYHKIGYQLSAYVALKESRRTGVEVAALLKDAGFDKNTAHNNLQDYANRSNINASFELKFPKMYSSWEPHESIPKEKVSLSNWMNQRAQHFPSPPMSQHSSMPAMQLPDTKLRRNMGAGYASYFSAATKLVNYGHRLMRFLPRVRVRGV